MSVRISNNLNLTRNEIQNVSFQKLGTDPLTTIGGMFYLNTDNTVRFRNNADTAWITLANASLIDFDLLTPANSGLAGGGTIDLANDTLNFSINASNLTSEATVDAANDTLIFYDTTAGATRKTTIANIISGAINDTSIYTDNGTLAAARTVTQGANLLTFTSNKTLAGVNITNINTGTGYALAASSSGDSGVIITTTKASATSLNIVGAGNTTTGIDVNVAGNASIPLRLISTPTTNTVVLVTEAYHDRTTPAANNGSRFITTAKTSTGVKKTFIEEEHLFTAVTNTSEQSRINLKLLHLNTLQTRFGLASSGQLQLNAYGTNTFTGTAAKFLAVTSAGLVIEEDAPTGSIEDAYGTMTDGTGTSTASGNDTFKFRSANNILSAAVTNNDATHGDNLLLTVTEGNINHDNLNGFVGNEHIDHSTVSIIAGVGLAGGGTITTNRTIDLDIPQLPALGETPATADTFAVYAAGAHRKVTYGELIDGVIGGVEYQGTWNATTNTPALVPSTGTKGHYYVVSVAGSTNLDGITDWKISDWVIFNGTAWEKVDNTDQVTSVFGRQGAIVAETSDYDAVQVDFDTTGMQVIQAGSTNVQDALEDLDAAVNTLTTTTPSAYKSGNVNFTLGGTHQINHNLNTRDVQVGVRDTTTHELVMVDAVATSVNQVTIYNGITTFTGVVTVYGF